MSVTTSSLCAQPYHVVDIQSTEFINITNLTHPHPICDQQITDYLLYPNEYEDFIDALLSDESPASPLDPVPSNSKICDDYGRSEHQHSICFEFPVDFEQDSGDNNVVDSLFSEFPFSSLSDSEFLELNDPNKISYPELSAAISEELSPDETQAPEELNQAMTQNFEPTEASKATKTLAPSELTPESSVTTKIIGGGAAILLMGTLTGVGGLIALGFTAAIVGAAYLIDGHKNKLN